MRKRRGRNRKRKKEEKGDTKRIDGQGKRGGGGGAWYHIPAVARGC